MENLTSYWWHCFA